MHFLDMLRMSSSNLWKRKIRTILTVLGVVIGTVSIVVMISIGLGLNRATIEQMSAYGSMTTIEVYRNYSWSSSGDGTDQYLSDSVVEQIRAMDHVDSVSPIISVSVMAQSGRYMGWLQLQGIDMDMLRQQGIELGQGELPTENDTELRLIYGNQILTNFYEKNTYRYYWETGVLPDIDLMNDSIFLIFDTDAYWQSQYNDGTTAVTPPKKYVIPAAGVVAGDENTYNSFSYYVYCDIDKLVAQLKKVFKNKAIPGQPTTSSGKPYKEFFYDQIYVNVDDMNNVTTVQEKINELGYQTYSQMEWVEYSQQQYAQVQIVLGTIGAVSLLVAAIGIANTMMMSIYERTKEIGIMKVLGCNIHNIQAMFLIEAAFIGFIGGIFGVGLSYGASALVNKLAVSGEGGFMGFSTEISYIPPWLTLVGVGFAVIVGTLAGFFPSLRAMRLSPLAAIRNE